MRKPTTITIATRGRGKAAVLYDKSPVPAQETEEGKQRLRDYYSWLGKFVDEFARVESVIAIALMHHAGISQIRARAVFSGVRADAASGHLRRLAAIQAIRPDEWQKLCPVLNQLGHLNTARNLILHYGARDIASGEGHATDARSALLAEKVRALPISPTILEDMVHDLQKIYIHIAFFHLGRPALRGKHPKFDAMLAAAWRYRPPQPAKQDRQKKR